MVAKKPRSVTLEAWTANLGRGVTTTVFERNLDRLLTAGGPDAWYLLQEIDEADAPDEHRIIARRVKTSHRIIGGTEAVLILVPKDHQVTRTRSTLGCKGLAQVTPHRPITEATVDLGPLQVTAFTFHLPLSRAATQARRAAVRARVKQRAEDRQSRGDAILWAADTNTHGRYPRMARREVSVVDAGIDQMRVSPPAGWEATVTRRRTVDLTIDGHNAHGARITMKEKKK